MNTQEVQNRVVTIKKMEAEEQVVFGEVYAPNHVDSQGEMMIESDIKKMAYRYMELYLPNTIDKNHNNVPTENRLVESFLARKNDPDGFTEGAWVIGLKVNNADDWQAIKKGELNGFSVQAMVKKVPTMVEMQILKHNVGETHTADDHHHVFLLEYNNEGKIVGGKTDIVDGHYHEIKKGSATEETNGHSHRY